MRRRPLTRKLTLAYMALILLVLSASGVILLQYLSRLFTETLEADLYTRAVLVRDIVTPLWPQAPGPEGDRLASRTAKVSDTRVTLIVPDGTVVGESQQPSVLLENHRNRPEVIAALAGRTGVSLRYSTTEKQRMLYVAVPVVKGELIAGVVRVSVSAESVYAQIDRIRSGLLVGLGIGLVLAALFGLWLGGRMLATPLGRVMEATRQFMRGRLDYTISINTGDEWEELGRALNEMAISIMDQVARLAAERDRVRGILESLPDGVLLLQRNGELLLANKHAREWLSLPEDLGTYVAPGDPGRQNRLVRDAVQLLGRTPELRAFVELAIRSPGDPRTELTLPGPVPRRVQVRSYTFGGQNSAAAGHACAASDDAEDTNILIVLRDISELRRLEQARRDLVANASHELKTPIGAIRALAESLMVSPMDDPEIAQDFLSRIVRETERLTGLVDEMLYLAKIESAHEALNIGQHELGCIMERAVRAVAPLAEAKNLTISTEKDPDTRLYCDGDRIERAMIAILDNAIKFSPKGSTIRVLARSHGSHVVFETTDQGPGISAEVLPRVFERFYKVEESRHTKGSGLGLSIVKHVVESHGGRAYAHSELGKGSTFGFILPRSRK